MKLTQVLKSPIVTEKSTSAQALRKYSFLVHLNTNKVEVKHAVEEAYGVDVVEVNIIPVLKKVRLVGRGREITRRQRAKKAIVTLKNKQSLDFNKIKTSK